jgi:hypothetical protein
LIAVGVVGGVLLAAVVIVARYLVNEHSYRKWDNLRAVLALYFAYYNFCRIHSTIRCTPAMESGIATHVWTLRDLPMA